MELIRVSYNNREYVLIYKNHKIEIGFMNHGSINYNITEEEKKLKDKILANFLISPNMDNYIKLNIDTHKGKRFQVFYDTVSNNKFYLEIKDKTYELPEMDDYKYLYSKYGASTILHCNEMEEEEKELEKTIVINTETLVVKIQKVAFPILLALSLIGNIENIKNANLNNKIVAEKVYEDLDYYEVLDQAIDENEYLSYNEKVAVKASLCLLNENKKYINLRQVEKRLKNIKIKYNNNMKSNNINYAILGTYNYNEINI